MDIKTYTKRDKQLHHTSSCSSKDKSTYASSSFSFLLDAGFPICSLKEDIRLDNCFKPGNLIEFMGSKTRTGGWSLASFPDHRPGMYSQRIAS